MSILTARGRLRPKMRLPVDRETTVFYSCLVDTYRLPYTVSTLQAIFLLPKTAERRFRPPGGFRPEVTPPFSSLTPLWYRSALEFFIFFAVQKLFDFFDLHAKCSLKLLGRDICLQLHHIGHIGI
jgi:hypothetical protein